MRDTSPSVAIVGLGYVGLPLAVEFGKKYRTVGFDISKERIAACIAGFDETLEVSASDMKDAKNLSLTNDTAALSHADFIIVAVPTPVDASKIPDLSALQEACRLVGKNLKKGSIIVFESTVYPGATEEVCIPILERESNLIWREHFNVGYSPERVNPGDKERTLTKIMKVVSGDCPETLESIADLYGSIVTAGIYRASDIKTAEAAKVIENTQRDLNIALVNELAIIFHKMNIDTSKVLEAAATKWNFLNFRPGLVGGHCIGVDPYYLTYKSRALGYEAEVILAGRRINDQMHEYIASETLRLMEGLDGRTGLNRVLVLGVTFKENCPDTRNSKVFDLINYLSDSKCLVTAHDPYVSSGDSQLSLSLEFETWENLLVYDAVVLAVPHKFYLELGEEEIIKKLAPQGVFIDVKSACNPDNFIKRGYKTWRL